MKLATKHLLGPKAFLFAALAYTLFIFIAFLLPTTNIPRVEVHFADKIVHIALHAGLVFLWLLYFIKQKKTLPAVFIGFVCAACIGFGILIEALQQVLTVSREADFFDVVANLVGSCIGISLFMLFKKRLN